MIDWIRELFDKPVIKYSTFIIGLGLLVFIFLLLTKNDEDIICREAGFLGYNESANMCQVESKYNNYIIITGNTANSPSPKLEIPDKLKKAEGGVEEIRDVIATGGTIKIVSAAPNNEVRIISAKENKEMDANGFVKTVRSSLNEVNEAVIQAPSTNGAAYYEAISKAGREAVSEQNKKTKIIVIGSGLSDSGILNFADRDYLHKDAEDVITAMDRAKELPYDLGGIEVIWYGIGQVKSPQEELSNSELETLKKLYSVILKRRGAKEVIFDDAINANESVKNNPYTVKTTKVFGKLPPIIEFTESELSFRANNSEITDKKIARMNLEDKGIFEYAKNNSSKTIVVTGYMAAGSCNSNVDTSLAGARAETVKRFLEENGIKNDIEVVNGGVFDPEETECVNGVWQSNLANYRRKVTINFK